MRMQPGTIAECTIDGLDLGDGSRLMIHRIEGTEELNQTYSFTVDVAWRGDDVRLEDFLDKKASVQLRSAHSEHAEDIPLPPRFVHGVVADVELHGKRGHEFILRLHLVPRLALLQRSTRCRAFMLSARQTIPDIIEEVLKDHRLEPGTDFDLGNLDRGRYPVRDYVVQYEETDFGFLQRWCEHEGIVYRFEQGGDGGREKIVFGDARDHYIDLTGDRTTAPPLRPEEDSGANLGNAALFSLNETRRTIPDHVVVQDYNWRDNTWRDPAGSFLLSQPTAAANGGAPATFECEPRLEHSFDTYYDTRDQGRFLLERRVQQIDANRRCYHGNGSCFTFAPGLLAATRDAGICGFDEDPWLLVTVEHHFTLATHDHRDTQEGSYGNSFTGVPASETWRPTRRTDWPSVYGVLHAVVDGERCDDNASDDSKEDPYALAEINANGEYRVRLPFDLAGRGRGATASCWVRMSQPHSGKDYGMHFPLNVGTEVLLAHIDGNPDRPVIVGTIPSAHTASPVNQHNNSQHIVRTASGHQMILDDLYESQRIVIENSKSTVFEMYGRDFTAANEFHANPSATHAAGGRLHAPLALPPAPYAPGLSAARNAGDGFVAIGDDGVRDAVPTPADNTVSGASTAFVALDPDQGATGTSLPAPAPQRLPTAASAHNYLGRGGKATAEEELQDYVPRPFPAERFWDHFRVSHRVRHLDFGSDVQQYVERDFLDTFRIVDREKYLPTHVDLDQDNHESADETRRKAITKPRELVYEQPSSREQADPNLQCYKYTGSIGWQWVNCGPEVGIQYGRVNRRTEGDVFTYHRGDQFHSHEAGDRYEFCAHENRYVYRSGHDYRYGGGYRYHNTVNEDLTEERFVNRHLTTEITYDLETTAATTEHRELSATKTWEQGLSTHNATIWKDVADVHLEYLICTTAQEMIDADRQTCISGQFLLHTGHDLQTVVGGDHSLHTVNQTTEVQGKQTVMAKSNYFTFKEGFTIKQSKAGGKPKPTAPTGKLSGRGEQQLKDAETMVDDAYEQAEKSDSHQKPADVRQQNDHSAPSPEGGGKGIGMEAKLIQMKSTGKYLAESTKDMSFKTKTNYKLEGAKLEIKGKSQVKINASTIHIG